MIKRIIPLLIIATLLLSGCYYRDKCEVDKPLQGLVDYVMEQVSFDILLSAKETNSSSIGIRVIVPADDPLDQYTVINDVLIAINDYLLMDNSVFCDRYINVHFSLPINRYSGEPGEELLYVTNRLSDGNYSDSLVRIYPVVYGFDSITQSYNIPDVEFEGVHILSGVNISDQDLAEYISSWPSIDTVSVSTTEQAEELQLEYPDIAFIAVE